MLTDKSETPAVELNMLDEEHEEIHRRYSALEDAIFLAQGSPRILSLARNLAQAMHLHFLHEAQFMERIAMPISDGQRSEDARLRADLLKIEEDLHLEGVYAALRLRSLCREWINQHFNVEHMDFEILAGATCDEPGRLQA
jgi:hemerythrin-like metal-binding protein